MKATLKPEEIKKRNQAETGAWNGMQQAGAAIRREGMVAEARERKEAGLPAEKPKDGEGMGQ